MMNLVVMSALTAGLFASYLWLGMQQPLKHSSSIRCIYDKWQNKLCHLNNAVYDPTSSAFNLHFDETSVVSGVKSYRELQRVQTSSIVDHNKFFANISVFLQPFNAEECVGMDGTVVALARFKPDNIMHVIHDDLLPLFVTLDNKFGPNWDPWQLSLLFLDGNAQSPYSFLYKLFTKNPFISPLSVSSCLNLAHLHIGLNVESVWYQYGFKRARGAVQPNHLTAHTLGRFRKFILDKLAIANRTQTQRVVILNRLITRKIVNIDKIVELVTSVYGQIDVIVANVTVTNARQVLELVANSQLLVGIHSAEMILALFLPKNASVIEIMPYNVPANISFLESLHQQKLAHFRYIQWFNKDLAGTIQHPEYPPHLGGIEHWPADEQSLIRGTSLGGVFCCSDPAFLLAMYQDTVIPESFAEAIATSRLEMEGNDDEMVHFWAPGSVTSLACTKTERGRQVSWGRPGNVVHPAYLVSVEVDGRVSTVRTNATKWMIAAKEESQVSVWVAAICPRTDHSSPDAFIAC